MAEPTFKLRGRMELQPTEYRPTRLATKSQRNSETVTIVQGRHKLSPYRHCQSFRLHW